MVQIPSKILAHKLLSRHAIAILAINTFENQREKMAAYLGIKLTSRLNKHIELLQTIIDIVEITRSNRGCISANIYSDINDENNLYISYEWKTDKERDYFLKTENFKILRWAMTNMGRDIAMQKWSEYQS